MTDIKERLLIIAETTVEGTPDATIQAWFKEAHDKIEELEAEVERRKDDLEQVYDDRNYLRKTVQPIHKAVAAEKGRCEGLWPSLVDEAAKQMYAQHHGKSVLQYRPWENTEKREMGYWRLKAQAAFCVYAAAIRGEVDE